MWALNPRAVCALPRKACAPVPSSEDARAGQTVRCGAATVRSEADTNHQWDMGSEVWEWPSGPQ